MPIKRHGSDASETDKSNEQTRILFKGVGVFDRSQVAAIDGRVQAPLEAPSQPLTGDSHAHLLEPMVTFANSLGFAVSFEPIPGATGGWCDPRAKRIVVDADQPANARLRILTHETIHALGVGYSEYGRERAEVIVDTATVIALGAAGLDTTGETIPYIAGWGEDGALQAVTEFATLINDLATRVEAIIAPAQGVATTRAA